MDDIGVINGCQNGRLQSAAASVGTRTRIPAASDDPGNVQLYDRAKVRT